MIKVVFLVLLVILFVPTVVANGEESAEKWKQYVESYKQYMEIYKEWAHNTINFYKTTSIESSRTIASLENENHRLEQENSKYKVDLDEMHIFAISLKQSLLESGSNLDTVVSSVKKYFEEENLKPKTTIYEQKILWHVSDSKRNVYDWSMPVETYEWYVRAYEPQDVQQLQNTFTGEVYTVRDHTKFVKSSFKDVIDNVYDNSENNADFVKEVWYIVSQLTTYSYDINEDPRWALETLSRGGGDCEDTAILIADMLKSSKHTQNWKIELVYFDAYNPQSPKTVNHVAVHINDGKSDYLVESTAKDNPYSWSSGVVGWYFMV